METVLDHGFVDLRDRMGSDLDIVASARVSYGQGSKGDEADKKLLRYLYEHDHGTPFEMVQFKFHVKCPIFIARQWFRHRIGSFNEISGRYTEVKDEYYVPEVWRGQDAKNKQGSADGLIHGAWYENYHTVRVNGEMSTKTEDIVAVKMRSGPIQGWRPYGYEEDLEARDLYETVINNCFQAYKSLLQSGVSKEMARMVLPLSTYTEFHWSVNLRSLMNFLRLREDSHSQWEMQQYAKAIKIIIRPYVPWTLELLNGDKVE